tara:strand:- start:6085 stop:9498 length:3414 start_codon:yes stop_codon:yes gene_type:complete
MSIKKENLHFFNKKGDNLNLFFDTVSGLYRGNYTLSEQPVSVELIESEQVIILEKIYSEEYSKFMYVKPTNVANDEAVIVFEIDITSQEDFFTFDITLDDDAYYINKSTEQVIEPTYDASFTDVVMSGKTYTNVPSAYNINILRQDYQTANIGFSSSEENSFAGKVNMYFKDDLSKEQIAEVFFFVDTVAEDTRLPLLLETMGHTLNSKDFLIFDSTNVNEQEIDFNIINKKRKELLLEFNNIFPYLGSYKALINIIKFFGYESLSIKEYWKNVKVDSANFGKYRPVDVESVLLNSNNTEELSDLFPSKVYSKTNKFGMYYSITEETGEYDEDGLPITKETSQFTIDEVLIKLYALKDKLKKYFLPLNSNIIDIVGEALYYSKIELNYWQSINRVDSIDININPTFTVYPNKYGFIQDLRPLEWVGSKIGPDLLLDGTSNLKVREFTLTNSFYDNTLRIIDTISGDSVEIIADYQSTDNSNALRLYDKLINHTGVFGNFFINLDGNQILFVEKINTGAIIESQVEQGRYAGVSPTLSYIDYLNGDQPIDNYKEAYLSYFYDRNFNILELSNNEDIPVGYPILLTNTSFEITWSDANVTWNSLDEAHNYNDFDYSSDTGFPTAQYFSGGATGTDKLSGVSWDDFGNSNFYELEWFIFKEATEESPYWSSVVKGHPNEYKEWAVNLPYSGEYTVELTLYDMYGSFSRNTEVSYITVEQKNPNFTAWKIKDLTDLTWDDLDNITWDEMNSSWELPFLPNNINDEGFIAWHSTDRVEFYQNLIKQDAILKSKGDINGQTWNNLGDGTTWEDVDHLYWDELSSTFTKFYITELEDTSVFGFNVKSSNGVLLETASFNRNVAIDNVYVDFIDQVYDLDETLYPVLSSFLYEYRPIVEFGSATIHQIVAISKAFESPNRFYFSGTECVLSNYNTPLNGFGAIGDSSAGFDIYTTSNIQSGVSGGATATIDIDGMTYIIPDDIITLSSLADDLNINSPFQDWEFNIVQSYQGGTAVQDEKILAYAKFYQTGEINTIKYSNVYGTKYARSVTTNATWNSLDVLYYQRDVKPYTQIYFNYDISNMPGFKNPIWIITKVGTGEVVFTWLNKYMVYLFTDVGEYDISLQLEDTNSNTKTITKNGLIKVT